MMYAAVNCYWIEPANLARLSLRRYARHDQPCPSGPNGYHEASVVFGHAAARIDADGTWEIADVDFPPRDHPLWPVHCACGYLFAPDDQWQEAGTILYQTPDKSWRGGLLEAHPGAMYDAFWNPQKGPDGLSIGVVLPNGRTWAIDGQASNCTMPNDTRHRCWIRHGEPPELTVDKEGYTCQSGAGSVVAGDYHGFLRGGVLSAG